MSTPATPENQAPVSLGWYIDLTKWLIGIATGTLVFGFDKLHVSELGCLVEVGFWTSAALLATSIGSGLLCCYQFIGYANRKETGPGPRESAEDVAGYRVWGTRFYAVCAGSLWIGIVIFGSVWAMNAFSGPTTESSAAPVIVTLPEKASALIIRPADHGASLVLTQNPDGTYSWRAIHAPSVSAVPATPAGAPALPPPQKP